MGNALSLSEKKEKMNRIESKGHKCIKKRTLMHNNNEVLLPNAKWRIKITVYIFGRIFD